MNVFLFLFFYVGLVLMDAGVEDNAIRRRELMCCKFMQLAALPSSSCVCVYFLFFYLFFWGAYVHITKILY